MQLEKLTALVTGAGQGVGQGIALELARHGARVAAAGRTLEKLRETCRQIEGEGGSCIPIQCDVKDPDSLASCVQTVVGHFGGLNILVNNAQEEDCARAE